jgi:CheY-like chemotaxis protein
VQRILVIDDHTANLELAVQILQWHGFSTLAARDGEEGLEKARTELPDLIVCDIKMPRMDGYEVAHELKSEPSTKDIPLLAMTGIASLEQCGEIVLAGEKLLSSGFDGYIPKPIDPARFIKYISSVVGSYCRLRPSEWNRIRATPSSRQYSFGVN